MAGRPRKEFHQYLINGSNSHIGHDEYLSSPATAFLRYTIASKSAIDLCIRHFPTTVDGTYTKVSRDNLQHLVISSLPALMGHFETYQKYLFAGIFDLSVFIESFNVEKFFRTLNNETKVNMDWVRLSAHRTTGASSVGSLLSDSIHGWHDPSKVNKYFSAFGLQYNLFRNGDKEDLQVLWQLRHSIVHTGSTLTLGDAQKVTRLHGLGGRNIAFEDNFIFEVSRKLHPLIKNSTQGIGNAFKQRIISSIQDTDRQKIDRFFEVKSTVNVWW